MGYDKKQGWVADVDLILTKHFTEGRGGNNIEGICVHHNAGILTAEQIKNTWETREASAHYQVENGGQRTSQHVWDKDTAWHAGNWRANQTLIGIEHANSSVGGEWPVANETIKTGAAIGASILAYYDLASPKYMENWFPHNYWQATACPGGILTKVDYMMSEAVKFYNQIKGVTATPEPSNKTYKVVTGDTLYAIAAKFNIKWQDLAGDNNIPAPYIIYPGEVLSIGWSTATEALPTLPDGKTFAQIVDEVIALKWGVGQDRVDRLRAAGWDYAEVQKEVNLRLLGDVRPVVSKSVYELAQEVIRGNWGNGQDRVARLQAAGYSFAAVQAEVNRLLG